MARGWIFHKNYAEQKLPTEVIIKCLTWTEARVHFGVSLSSLPIKDTSLPPLKRTRGCCTRYKSGVNLSGSGWGTSCSGANKTGKRKGLSDSWSNTKLSFYCQVYTGKRKALSDYWSRTKFSFSLSRKYKVVENRILPFIRSLCKGFIPGPPSFYYHLPGTLFNKPLTCVNLRKILGSKKSSWPTKLIFPHHPKAKCYVVARVQWMLVESNMKEKYTCKTLS